MTPPGERGQAAEIRNAAEGGQTAAQRELARRLVFGDGVTQDLAEAWVWLERAARAGDATAALWLGRKYQEEPADTVAAGAWLYVARRSADPAIREDAEGEWVALGLGPELEADARARADALKVGVPPALE